MADSVYRFPPRDTGGVLLGLGGRQVVILGAAIAATVLALSAGVPLIPAAVPAAP